MAHVPPKVSVLIPTYNQARYLPEAIESVLTQDLNDFEVIISDNCSNDGSAELISSYAARDSRVRYRIQPANLGMVRNFNWCLSDARGDYIKFVCGDDKLASRQALTRLVALLEANASATLAASARLVLGGDSRILKVRDDFGKNGIHVGKEVIAQCLATHRNLIGEPSVTMFRKQNARRGFNPNYRQIVDEEMWLYLLEQGDLAYTSEPLCGFREHSQQQSELNRSGHIGYGESWRLLWEYHSKPYLASQGLRPRMFAELYDLRKRQRRPGCLSDKDLAVERELTAAIGGLPYARYWVRRKVTRPFENWLRWLRRRRASAALSDARATQFRRRS
jgi:hypothetical protein